jgi:phosphoglycolate phosphatase
MPPGSLKAIVFDLDGTLIDSAPDLRAALNRLLAGQERHALTIEQVKLMIGDGAMKLVERAFAVTGPEIAAAELAAMTAAFLEDYEMNSAVLTRPFPAVVETLARLGNEGYTLALCTNKPQTATMQTLDCLELADYFQAVIGGDLLPGLRKPDPRHLLAALERLGVAASGAVMVGDNANDVAVARGAGMPVILVTFGYSRIPAAELGADAVISCFDELPAALLALS